MYKKKLLIILIIIAILSVMTVISNAATNGVITGETVKLRKAPSLDAGLVTLLSVDNKVEVLGKEGDWYQVKYKEYEGYVYADYIDVEGEVVDNTATTNKVTNNTVENTVNSVVNAVSNETIPQENVNANNTVTNTTTDTTNSETQNSIIGTSQKLLEDCELKILPLINAETVQTLVKDTTVTVDDEVNGWAFISTDTVSGWIRADKLTAEEAEQNSPEQTENTEPEEETPATTTETQTGYISASSVNVRASASTSANVVTTLTRNTAVTIEGQENGWTRITTSTGVSGYVSSEYISDEQVQSTNRSDSERTQKIVDLPNTTADATESEDTNTVVVNYAKTLLGKSYVYGGVGPNSFDCSGFTQYVYSKFGVNLSHSASAQANIGTTVSKVNLQLGDMVFFSQGGSSIGHVGIFVGNNSFIHAANPQKGVVITSLSDGYYTTNYKTAKRVL
jgi:cell wall-associated NlpC family hydrolase